MRSVISVGSFAYLILNLAIALGCTGGDPQQRADPKERESSAPETTGPTKALTPADTQPFLTVDGCEEVVIEPSDPQHDSKVLIWHLRGGGVREFSARLVGFRDRKPAPEFDAQVRFEMLDINPSDREFTAKLIYAVVRGDPFRSVGSRAASLQLDVTSKGSHSITVGGRECMFVLPEIPPAGGLRRQTTSLPDQEMLLFYDFHCPLLVGPSYSANNVEELAELSRDRGLSWGIVVDWKPSKLAPADVDRNDNDKRS